MRPLVLLMLPALAGCLSSGGGDRRETTGNKPPATGSNTGIVDGNGGELRQRAPLAPPDFPELRAFLAELTLREPTWAYLFTRALTPGANEAAAFLATDEPCFLQTAPSVEVRAYYDRVTNAVTLCRPYGQGTPAEKLAIVLHELTHYALYMTRTNLGDGEEDVVQLFEAAYKPLWAPEALASLRALLEKWVPKLAGVAAEVPASSFGPFRAVKMLKDHEATYPVPERFYAPGYEPQRLGEFPIAAHWTMMPEYKAASLLALPALAALDPALPSSVFSYPEFSYAERFRVKTVPLEAAPEGCAALPCLPRLSATWLDAAALTDEFAAYLRSLPERERHVRLVNHFVPAEPFPLRRDRVFFVRGL